MQLKMKILLLIYELGDKNSTLFVREWWNLNEVVD